jgi:hypothetical protein
MLNVLSILFGLLALVFVIPGILPILGALNWLALPIAVLGAGIGVVSSRNTGRNLNLFILIVAIVRLSLGGGIF